MPSLPRAWPVPAKITPAWLAAQPPILNEAIKSLVAAGYGAALLPRESGSAAPDERLVIAPLTPPLWRPLGLACRTGRPEPATRHVLDALVAIQQR